MVLIACTHSHLNIVQCVVVKGWGQQHTKIIRLHANKRHWVSVGLVKSAQVAVGLNYFRQNLLHSVQAILIIHGKRHLMGLAQSKGQYVVPKQSSAIARIIAIK